MKIASISYLTGEVRTVVKASRTGRFSLIAPTNGHREFRGSRIILLKAKDFITHELIKNNDPVLTLSTGEKMRVYLSGDPTAEVVQALGIAEVHDEENDNTGPAQRDLPKAKPKGKENKDNFSKLMDDYDFPYTPDFDFGDDKD